MPRIIRSTASSDAILELVKVTIGNAKSKAEPVPEDANAYLGPVVEVAKALATEGEANDEALKDALGYQAEMNEQAELALGGVRDADFNQAKRTASDPLVGLLLPLTLTELRSVSVFDRPDELEVVAAQLERGKHPRIAPETLKAQAAQLRAAAQKLREANQRVTPLRATERLIGRQNVLNAKYGQLQLKRLKQHWIGEGLTPTEVHEIIPSVPRPTRKKKTDLPDESEGASGASASGASGGSTPAA